MNPRGIFRHFPLAHNGRRPPLHRIRDIAMSVGSIAGNCHKKIPRLHFPGRIAHAADIQFFRCIDLQHLDVFQQLL